MNKNKSKRSERDMPSRREPGVHIDLEMLERKGFEVTMNESAVHIRLARTEQTSGFGVELDKAIERVVMVSDVEETMSFAAKDALHGTIMNAAEVAIILSELETS